MGQSKSLEIDGRKIGSEHPPYIIADLSIDLTGEINRVFQAMEAITKSDVDAVVLPVNTHESSSTVFEQLPDNWNEWQKPVFEKAHELGLTIVGLPLDLTAVETLEKKKVPVYKISPFLIGDLALIKRVAQTGKPILFSTGMASEQKIAEAIKTAKLNGCRELVVLHAVDGYPVTAEQYNLKTILDISKRFDVLSGLSDQAVDTATAVTSIALGACLIEKRVSLGSTGSDDGVSPCQYLKTLCQDTKVAWQALGNVNYERTAAEKGNVKFRRSLYIVEDVKEGEEFTSRNVRSIRPGFGVAPKYYNDVLGKKALSDISRGTALKFEHFEA